MCSKVLVRHKDCEKPKERGLCIHYRHGWVDGSVLFPHCSNWKALVPLWQVSPFHEVHPGWQNITHCWILIKPVSFFFKPIFLWLSIFFFKWKSYILVHKLKGEKKQFSSNWPKCFFDCLVIWLDMKYYMSQMSIFPFYISFRVA